MNLGTLINISEKIDSINTSESYCDKCYLSEDSLLLPFIKLDLLEKGVIGNENERLNLEFSYLILDGIKELNWIGKNELGERIVGGSNVGKGLNANLKDWFAINQKNGGFEIKVLFENLRIFVPKDSRIGTEWWTPYDTPNFKQNIKSKIVDDFFDLKNIPKELAEQIKVGSLQSLIFSSGLEGEIKLIEQNWVE
tara:strand:+ start:84 stop:668 length:585 start_codon:yes stop_codon:yes gene_type:complete